MSELTELLERFRRGPEVVAAALTGAAGMEVDYRPSPEQWSVRQIVAHLSDSEMVASIRFRRIIAEEDPAVEPSDQNAWAEKLDYGKRKYSASLEMFRRVRAENYELLKALPADAYQRTCRHPKRGTMTLLETLEIFAGHPEKHALQIQRMREAYKAYKATTAGVS
jgi:hypothetical protein